MKDFSKMRVFSSVILFVFGKTDCLDENGNENFKLMDWSSLKKLQQGMKNARAVDVPKDTDLDLDYDTVARLASLPLHCHSVEYPNKLNQVLQNQSELLSPSGQLLVGSFRYQNSFLNRTPSYILRLF